MEFYALQNPLGCVLKFVDAYSQLDEEGRTAGFLQWARHQNDQMTVDSLLKVYSKYAGKLFPSGPLFGSLFQDLGWTHYWVEPKLEQATALLQNQGLLTNGGNVMLTGLGRHLMTNDTYRKYIESESFRAQFWINNNVKITGSDIGGGIGSGSFIGEHEIITARHVVDDLHGQLKIEGEDGREYTIEQIIKHPDEMVDLAKIITVEPFDFFPLTLEEEAEITDRVVIFGYPPIPLSTKPFLVVNTGEISALVDNYIDKTDCMILSCFTRPGNSGGPVLNRYGKLIGVVIQNRSNQFGPSWNDMKNFDVSKALPYATALRSKYILQIS